MCWLMRTRHMAQTTIFDILKTIDSFEGNDWQGPQLSRVLIDSDSCFEFQFRRPCLCFAIWSTFPVPVTDARLLRLHSRLLQIPRISPHKVPPRGQSPQESPKSTNPRAWPQPPRPWGWVVRVYLVSLYGKSWELNLLKGEMFILWVKSITSFTSFTLGFVYFTSPLRGCGAACFFPKIWNPFILSTCILSFWKCLITIWSKSNVNWRKLDVN
jgi:hypothetical protein